MVEFWLNQGWEVNRNIEDSETRTKKDGVITPLHMAKGVAVTRYLLSRGAQVNVWSRYAGTPLHSAVIAALEASQRGRKRITPDSQADQIRALLEAGADPSIANFEGQTPLALAVQLRRKTAEKALREAGAPEKGNRPKNQPIKAAAIDLRKDSKRVTTALVRAIKRFSRQKSVPPITGTFIAVSGIEGYVIIAFDVNDAENPWDASHSEFETLQFMKWRDAYELSKRGVRITGMDGSIMDWPNPIGDLVFEKPFFDACVRVLEEAEKANLFAPLSRNPNFLLGVEASLAGHYKSWQATC